MSKVYREWEEFAGGPLEPLNERLHVTLSERCILHLNRNIFAALGCPSSAKLLYDRRNQTIGVRPAGPGETKAFPVKPHPKGSHRGIHAKPFCRHYKIIPVEHVRFTDPRIENGILILCLHETEPVVPKKRRPKAVGK